MTAKLQTMVCSGEVRILNFGPDNLTRPATKPHSCAHVPLKDAPSHARALPCRVDPQSQGGEAGHRGQQLVSIPQQRRGS